jgi:acyl-coenzyme A thioesterase PaaI-like protein
MPRRGDDARMARRISAEGKLIKPGRQTSYAEGFVRDGSGDLAVYPTAAFSMAGEGARTK